MTNQPQAQPERRGRGRSCGCLLVSLLVVALAGFYAYVGWLRPAISAIVAREIGGEAGATPQAQSEIQKQIETQGPTVAAALPSGTLMVSDQQVNDYLQANPQALKPLDKVSVAFTPGLVTAQLNALGTTSTASTGLAVADGRLTAVNPQISGPLAALVKADVIAQALTKQLNDQLAAQNRRATAVKVEQGQLVIMIE